MMATLEYLRTSIIVYQNPANAIHARWYGEYAAGYPNKLYGYTQYLLEAIDTTLALTSAEKNEYKAAIEDYNLVVLSGKLKSRGEINEIWEQNQTTEHDLKGIFK